jgi:hypothetical protein
MASWLMLGALLTLVISSVVMFLTGNVAADDQATVYYYGLQLIEWFVIALMFVMLVLFVWMKHMYLFAMFVVLLIVELVLHYFII